MKYAKYTLGQIEAIINKLGGEEGADAFLRGELVVKMAEKMFAIWKTIQIGQHAGAKGYLAALDAAGRKVYDWAKDIMGKKEFTTASAVEDINLVKVTPRDLGFTRSPRFDAFIARGLELGLELCPAEVGPALRLAYGDQPKGEWIRVAMETIAGSGGGPRVFRVGHDEDGLVLGTDWYRPSIELDLDLEWVFRSRSK